MSPTKSLLVSETDKISCPARAGGNSSFRMMRIFQLTLLLLSCLFLSSPSKAQWSNDPYENTLISYGATGNWMISDGQGGAVIYYRNDLDGRVHLQRLDRYGYKSWGEDGIILNGDGDYQGAGFSCLDNDGGIIVTFNNHFVYYPAIYTKLYAQKVDNSGNLLWGLNGQPICTQDSSHASCIGIKADGAGGFFLAYTYSYSYFNQTIYIQHLDAEGNLTWPGFGVDISGNIDDMYNASLLSGGPGYALLLWHVDDRIHMQRVDLEGNQLWGTGGILFPATMGWFDVFTRSMEDGHGGAVVSGYHNGLSGIEIYTQRCDSSGNLLWGEFGVLLADSLLSPISTGTCKLVCNEAGYFYLWMVGASNTSTVYMQKLILSGQAQWGPGGLQVSAEGINCTRTALVNSGPDAVIAGWYDVTNGCYAGQKIDAQGSLLWSEVGVPVTYNMEYFVDPLIISDMAGGAIFDWEATAIYAQQVSTNGILGEVLGVKMPSVTPLPEGVTLLPSYPNPFNNDTIIPIAVQSALYTDPVYINLLDPLGRYISRTTFRFQSSGIFRLRWSELTQNRRTPSGVYILEVMSKDGREATKIIKIP